MARRSGGPKALLLALAIIAGSPATARADWRYLWSCMGNCEMDTGPSGRYEYFATYEQCQEERDRRWRTWEGRYVTIARECEEVGVSSDVTAGPVGVAPEGPPRPNPFKNIAVTRFETAFVVSSGWSVRERGHPTTYPGAGAGALAFDIHGGRPQFSVLFGTQLGVSRVDSPFFHGPDGIFVWTVHTGFSSTPFSIARGRAIDLRPVVGVRFGLAVPGGCAELCDNPSVFFPSVGFFGRVSAGLAAFLGPQRTIGIGFEAGIPFGRMGDVDDFVAPTDVQFDAPAWEAALTIQVRNSDVRGW